MQKLGKRNTYTPRDISHVPSNCEKPLKDLRGRVGASSLKTLPNNLDATLTGERPEQNTRVTVIYVQTKSGKALMPTTPRKARLLLKQEKATVVKRTPFVIRLVNVGGGNTQKLSLGVDSGFENIGLSVVNGIENQEIYSAEVKLRSDIVKLNSERRSYRRTRRNLKTWYRKPRFLNRKKEAGWLAPSIQHKLDSHIKLIDKVAAILPISKIVVEVANFDIQKIKNPDISGTGYQKGEQLGFWNVREYVLHRDGFKCQHCQGKSKDKVLNVHHIKSRQIGGDRPENLITLCNTCHKKYHQEGFDLKAKPSKGFKAETFMSTVRWAIVNQLKQKYQDVTHTYGYITKNNRIKNSIEKSHANDAFCIAGGNFETKRCSELLIKQVRSGNRKLFKGIRSHIRNTAPRFMAGFQRFDKVSFENTECFIFGRRKTGYMDLRLLNGKKIHASAKVKELSLLESSSSLLTNWKLKENFNGVLPHS